MSEENVEVVRSAYKAFAEGGVEAAMPMFAPDLVMYPFPEWTERAAYRGHDGLRALLAEWTENFDGFELAVSEFKEIDDMVLVLAETVGWIKNSQVPIRQPIGTICSDFQDGRIGTGRSFLTWPQALKAAGLSE